MHKEWSLQLAKFVDANQNECFDNCAKAIQKMLSEKRVDWLRVTLYVEGYVLVSSMPQEHAWLKVNGEIVDPTLILNLDLLPEPIYFEGISFPSVQLLQKIAARVERGCNPLPLYFLNDDCTPCNYGESGFGKAYGDAWSYIKEKNKSARETH